MKKPATSYQERVRLAVEGMHSKIASDPQEPEDHRLAARQALTAPTAQEVVDDVTERAGTNRVAALKALRQYLTGKPELAMVSIVVLPPAPTEPEFAEVPEQGTEEVSGPQKQAITPGEPVKKQGEKQATDQAEPVVSYVAPGSGPRKVVESGRYLDSPSDQAWIHRQGAKKIRE